MSDRILPKYLSRDIETTGAAVEPDAAEDLGAFGWLRGIRDRAIMLELRKRTGNILAIGYGWIEKIEYDASEGITLHALGQKFRIKGQNLNAEIRPSIRLFEGLCRHRVPYIQEASSGDKFKVVKGGTTTIEAIDAV